MKSKIFKAYKNQFCQECGQRDTSLVEVTPNLVNNKIRLCLKCYKANFRKDLEV